MSHRKYDDYEKDSLGRMGYQAQEFDNESGELVSSEDGFDDDVDDYDDEDDDAFESDSEGYDGDGEF